MAKVPDLVQVRETWFGRGGEVLFVSHDLVLPDAELDPTLGKLLGFALEHGIRAPILLLEGDSVMDVLDHFELPGALPYTMALDQERNLVDDQMGSAPPERLDALMRKALGAD